VRRQLIIVGAALILGASCSEPYLGVKLPFVATWAGQTIHCDDPEFALSDLRLYVSAIELHDRSGRAHPLVLHDNLQWQQSDLALIDLEDGKGACINGSSETYPYLVGSVPPGDYQGIRFIVGVPFERNHADPLTAAKPLDNAAMHWHWRSGYKFLRAGVRTPTDGFWIHVGSAGCEGTVRDITGCRFPNRVTVELPNYVPGRDSIAIDLKALLADVDLHDGEATDCSSGPPESACIGPFAALGIDFESGKPAGQQRVFAVLQ